MRIDFIRNLSKRLHSLRNSGDLCRLEEIAVLPLDVVDDAPAIEDCFFGFTRRLVESAFELRRGA